MDSEQLLATITSLIDGVRSDMTKLGERCDAISSQYDDLAKKADAIIQSRGVGARRMDGDDDGDDHNRDTNRMARQTAADRARSDAVETLSTVVASLASSVADMKKQQTRPMADLDAFADAQSKADAVMRTHGQRAEPPMAGEDLIAYNIRLAKKMQPHSQTWKGVHLELLAPDKQAFGIAMDAIRADALHAGLNPVHLPPFEHRMIQEVSPGGHTITKFVGRGTMFAQMSRPIRYVKHIGTRQM